MGKREWVGEGGKKERDNEEDWDNMKLLHMNKVCHVCKLSAIVI